MPSLDIARPEFQHVTVQRYDHVNGTVTTMGAAEVQVKYLGLRREASRTPGWRTNRTVRNNPPMNPLYFRRETETVGGTSSYREQLWNASGELFRDNEDVRDGPLSAYTGRGSAGAFPGSSELALTARDISVANDRAVTNVLLEVKDQKVNVGQVIAERMQTTKLLDTTVRRVTKMVTELRRRNWNGAADAIGVNRSARKHRKHIKRHSVNPDGAVAQSVLELQYGWRPLLQDLYGSMELLVDQQSQRYYSVSKKRSSIIKQAAGVIEIDDIHSLIVKQSRKYGVKYTLYYATPERELHTLGQIGLTNPALVAWELVPWSFVVDWFLPIGNFISSFDATLGLEFVKGMKTVSDEVTETITHVGGVRGSKEAFNRVELRIDVQTASKVFEVRSTPLTEFPSPRIPSFKNPLSVEHGVNAIALLVAGMRGKRPGGQPNRPGTSDSTRPVKDWYDWGEGKRS